MKEITPVKKTLHPRNKHNTLYDFDKLILSVPELENFLMLNPRGQKTIDFADPKAVVLLNKAILISDYKITYWEMPVNNLCPPIPSRADYIHYIADILASHNKGKVPTGEQVKILDLGVGANAIFPLIGVAEYDWNFVGSELSPKSIKSAAKIVENNPHLQDKVVLRIQPSDRNILKNVVKSWEKFDVAMCNPPFFKSKEEMLAKNLRKVKNLSKKGTIKPVQNFSGVDHELWCEGGEKAFITNYIYESCHFKDQIKWFTSLVSNKDNLKSLVALLKKVEVKEHRIVEMQQGNKTSRLLVWRFKN